ncbi:TylF/MycF/NovP-related O-methyltransferase [Hydrogenophaga sp. OTU3427]|uniref:TylF/MycF/NovP-related O-methyltransferase n=1 Tax=Hydrogenophaga sp. OTU3427 TaxID=3043856 RepID=UPI00313B83F1
MNPRNLLGYIKLVLGFTPNEVLGFRLIAFIAQRLAPNYKMTWPELAWFKDPTLSRTLEKFNEAKGFNAHRRLALQELVRLTLRVPGDTVECGAYLGCGSHLILEACTRHNVPRTHHIFDSFEGLSTPTEIDGSYWKNNDLAAGEAIVRKNLNQYPNTRYYKGWIPSRFSEVGALRFSFVHVDVDLYQPTHDSISFFYDRLNHGAIFVCDDYGFNTCPGATKAIDEFLETRPEKMIRLAGGGGFFIKGIETTREL